MSGNQRKAGQAAAVARALIDAWNVRDLDRVLGLLTDDVEWHDPAMPEPPARGKPAIRSFVESLLVAFPDFSYEIREPLCTSADGTRCIVPWRIRATHMARLSPPGYAPTNRTMTVDGLDQLDFRGDRIARVLTCFDVILAAEQLLGIGLRPRGSRWHQRAIMGAQRLFALRARRLRTP